MKLPLLISVPHAGLNVPPEVEDICLLDKNQIEKDGDEGASHVFNIGNEVTAFVTTDIARAFVDVNRAADDFRADGVVKTHTIYQEPVYAKPLPKEIISGLLNGYYHPYHSQLTQSRTNVVLGLDCHTMAAVGPPIAGDAGQERPLICISNADGTCSSNWMELMAECLAESFGVKVSLNKPFAGGYIIRKHTSEIPWMQIEISRAEFFSISAKRQYIIEGLSNWYQKFQTIKL